ncbi:nucleotide sugar dehydrogenase [Macrococcoides goetzii]|nr:nucleotide sugar dehydrogenase [Macrococcus goetzii]TDM46086.1 nucleotide sugar dehydrogenase [Macrococcus goetzii]
MNIYENLINRKTKIAIIGLGYVGMPIAHEFSKKVNVIGYDINEIKINRYLSGFDDTNEIGDEEIRETKIEFTSDEKKLSEASVFIVTVPTPINIDNTPNLLPVKMASKTIAKYLKKDSIVIYESTVYPGVTEEICMKILEKESGLICGKDFKIGYSPERINPGDKVNKLRNIVKIVSAIDNESREEIKKIYKIVVDADIHLARSIKVAEAAKVVENSQRDINIAFMNELAIVFDKMNIDTQDVIDAMNTKWNSLGFTPGLVGGHCIGVDPYYFIYEAEKLGYHSQIVLSGRKTNNNMSNFITKRIIKELIITEKLVSNAKVAIFGVTFKENTPDVRNSKVLDIVNHLKEYSIEPILYDPVANLEEISEGKYITNNLKDIADLDCIVYAVPHDEIRKIELDKLDSLFNKSLPNNKKIIIDIKSALDKDEVDIRGYRYWRL